MRPRVECKWCGGESESNTVPDPRRKSVHGLAKESVVLIAGLKSYEEDSKFAKVSITAGRHWHSIIPEGPRRG